MGNNASTQKLSLVRLVIVLVTIALLIFFGAKYVSAIVADLRIGVTTIWFAPYVDVTLTPMMHFEDEVEQLSDEVVLGFVVADPLEPCQPSWGTYYNLDAAARALDLDRRIVRLRERGGDVMVSFGGAINNELATVCKDGEALVAAYQAVIDRYDLQATDFNIEGVAIADREANRRRAEAIKRLQRENENLEIWLTLPIAPHGLSAEALTLVNDFLEAGIRLAGINLMTMNYAESRTPGMSMHEATVAALITAKDQLGRAYLQAGIEITEREMWQLIGATPMIGQNDVLQDIFTTKDAHGLVDFARIHNLGRLSFWSVNRDAPCGPGADRERVSNTCSGVEQEPREFSDIFANGVSNRIPFSSVIGGRTESSITDESAAAITPFARDDPRTSPYPLWRSERAYEMGSKVVWQGRVYEAKWWSEGDQPDAPVENVWETPWRYLGPVLESDHEAVRQAPVLSGNWNPWSAEKVYLQGDEIEYQNQVFRAKWWTQGDLPEEFPDQPFDHPWQYLGEVNCNGDSCVGDEIAATLSVDYKDLVGVSIEIRQDDEVEGTAGRLVQAHSNQSGQKTYEVLQGKYDLVYRMASAELVVDSVTCLSDTCDNRNIATTLSVDYEGLTDIRLEIRTNDGIHGTVGNLVQAYDSQSGQRSYSVLRGNYDLLFYAGGTELTVDEVTCSSDGCDVSSISAILTVDYDGLADVHLEIRNNDSIDGTAGTLIQAHDNQRGQKSYHVLRGSYDLLFEKGAAEYIIDDFDCLGRHCDASDIAADLTVRYAQSGQSEVSVEIRADDGQADTVGGLVEAFDEQSGRQMYRVLRGSYDIVEMGDGWEKVHDAIDCSGERCLLVIPLHSTTAGSVSGHMSNSDPGIIVPTFRATFR